MTPTEIDILLHTRRTGRYVSDEPEAISLAARGYLFDYGAQRLAGGMHYMTLTSKGRDAIQEHLASLPPARKPKPLSRSKRRYMRFLATDCGMRFGDWLKTQWAKEAV